MINLTYTKQQTGDRKDGQQDCALRKAVMSPTPLFLYLLEKSECLFYVSLSYDRFLYNMFSR